jgi:LysR family transcriptional regulator, benzoate and cis,cis-muconate-responsive activator of ben and cat genes
MELHHLRAFSIIAESRSFSKAARQLHVSQPPLSRHIHQLEEELGVKLFVRSASGVELTREGLMLLEQARTVLAEADGFVELAGRAKTGVANRLRVGMARGLCEVVNRIRLHLLSRVPEITIEGSDVASSSQYRALEERTIDIGVSRHVAEDPAVRCETLFRERFVVVVSENNPLSKRKSLQLKQLADEPLLLHKREWAALSYDKILQLYANADVTPNIVTLQAEPGDQASMLAVASGKGISLALQSPVSRSYLPVTGVAAVPLEDPDAELQVQVAWRNGETSRTVHQFLEAARKVFPSNEVETHAEHV